MKVVERKEVMIDLETNGKHDCGQTWERRTRMVWRGRQEMCGFRKTFNRVIRAVREDRRKGRAQHKEKGEHMEA